MNESEIGRWKQYKQVIPYRVDKEEDLNLRGIVINGPPPDGRCEVCGRHLSELQPFDEHVPGYPVEEDLTGALLVKNFRRSLPYDEESEKIWEEFEETRKGEEDDITPNCFIAKYGEEKGKELYFYGSAQSVGSSWECRDCLFLNEKEYFELRQR